ncbi:methylated-DNA--[protein]-cysteine S-methyltransferase [Sphingomicrobium sp. XHP0235]|uniref:methylated-DNA--[protein]-cysteine S-methyltransferase n=1 Tax=Sphingomicrobium aquimarinum TaxID=3133971 RepID=UPI0031FE50D1
MTSTDRQELRYTIVDTALGQALLAASDMGICRVSFEEDEDALRRLYPTARSHHDSQGLAAWGAQLAALIEAPSAGHDLPLDLDGTAFQESVWRALQDIPPGETRTYAQVAAAAGRPGADRAAGAANGANRIAVLVPCHRVIRSDGGLGGYAHGLERKRRLLEAEGVRIGDFQHTLDL